MVSPRLGFNWTPTSSGKDQIRGGVGVFAGRTPFVWISNAYGGTGIEMTSLTASNVPFNPDPYNPPKNFPPGTAPYRSTPSTPTSSSPGSSARPSPTTASSRAGSARPSRGCSRRPCRTSSTRTSTRSTSGAKTFYGAPVYKNKNTAFNNVTYLTNTSRGEQQNISATLEKRFPFGLYAQRRRTPT